MFTLPLILLSLSLTNLFSVIYINLHSLKLKALGINNKKFICFDLANNKFKPLTEGITNSSW